MGFNAPEQHHSVAKMLLRNFLDKSGSLWTYKRHDHTSRPYRAYPKSLFTEKNLNTQYANGGKQAN